MSGEENVFSDEYSTKDGTKTPLPQSEKATEAVSELTTSAYLPEEHMRRGQVAGTSGSSSEQVQQATSDYYVAKPKPFRIRAKIIDDQSASQPG
jgi:hypothetical protein